MFFNKITSAEELAEMARDPKIFHMTEGRDYMYYFDPVLAIIKHEGKGTLVGPYEDHHKWNGPIFNIEYLGDLNSEEEKEDDFVWRLNEVQMRLSELREHISSNMCNG